MSAKMEVVNVVREAAHIGPVGKRSIVKVVISGKNFTMCYVEFPLGARPEEHVRENEEAIYVLSGEALIEFPELAGQKPHRLPAGSAMYLPPGVRHRHANGGNETMRMLAVFSPPGEETAAAKASPVVDTSKL